MLSPLDAVLLFASLLTIAGALILLAPPVERRSPVGRAASAPQTPGADASRPDAQQVEGQRV